MALRVGVIGIGTMGADHVRTLATAVSGAEVVAVADALPRRAAQVAAEYGGCRVHAEPLDLVRDPGVDAVVVASPDDAHEGQLLACIEAGKPVLCEKPLAETPEACLRVAAAEARRGRRVVQVGFMRRFDPGYVEMKRTLDSGGVGEALLVHCVHRNLETPSWYPTEKLFTSSATHEIDIIRWLLGEEIESATVHPVRSSGNVPGLRDPQFVVLRTESGVVADIEIFVNARYGYDVRCELVGDSGTVSLVPPAAVTTRRAGLDGRAVPPDWRERFAAAYRAELQYWADAAGSGRAGGPTVWDGYVATMVAAACVTSMTSGASVSVQLPDRPAFYAPF